MLLGKIAAQLADPAMVALAAARREPFELDKAGEVLIPIGRRECVLVCGHSSSLNARVTPFQARTMILAAQRLCSTSRAVTTPTSRSVSMILPDYNPNPVIDVRRRW
jgi:hypothetical protein